MGLTLVVGRSEDRLVSAYVDTLGTERVVVVDERHLLEDVVFELELDHEARVRLTVGPGAMVHHPGVADGDGITLTSFDPDQLPAHHRSARRVERIDAVLLRPCRNWWPGHIRDPQDRSFVFHETLAAWLAVFDALTSPVVNRFPISWWLHDRSLPDRFLAAFRESFGLVGEVGTGFGAPTRRSVYVAGVTVVPGRDADARLIATLLSRPLRLRRWQERTGLCLARLDFAPDEDDVVAVDPTPDFESEPPETVASVARALAVLQ
jgi:hypothetical protein